jgi:hypothetical protein
MLRTVERGAQPIEKRFEVSGEMFSRLSEILGPVEDLVQEPCDDGLTDQDMEQVSWTMRGQTTSLSLDHSCQSESALAAASIVREADALVRRWASTQPSL